MEAGKKKPRHPRSVQAIVDGVLYPSLRQAAKALHVSQTTLLAYVKGKVRRSVLRGVVIRLIKGG